MSKPGSTNALASRAFQRPSPSRWRNDDCATKPKQTDTTRRWKFTVKGASGYLNTKIEFSARGGVDPERAFEAARDDLGRGIGLRVVKAEHYLPPAAIRQKIGALAQRSETEPRDVSTSIYC